MGLCHVFCNNTRKNRRLYLSYRALDLICAGIQTAGFYCLFVMLDKRFSLIGYNYWTNHDSVETIFEDSVLCRGPQYNEESVVGIRQQCNLPLQTSFKFTLIFLWHLYIGGAIIHVANILFKAVVFITCNDKRYVLHNHICSKVGYIVP